MFSHEAGKRTDRAAQMRNAPVRVDEEGRVVRHLLEWQVQVHGLRASRAPARCRGRGHLHPVAVREGRPMALLHFAPDVLDLRCRKGVGPNKYGKIKMMPT